MMKPHYPLFSAGRRMMHARMLQIFRPYLGQEYPDFGRFTMTKDMADVLAGMLGDISCRRSAFLELSCDASGWLCGSRLDLPRKIRIVRRDFARAQFYALARGLGLAVGERFYLLDDLLPQYHEEVQKCIDFSVVAVDEHGNP